MLNKYQISYDSLFSILVKYLNNKNEIKRAMKSDARQILNLIWFNFFQFLWNIWTISARQIPIHWAIECQMSNLVSINEFWFIHGNDWNCLKAICSHIFAQDLPRFEFDSRHNNITLAKENIIKGVLRQIQIQNNIIT